MKPSVRAILPRILGVDGRDLLDGAGAFASAVGATLSGLASIAVGKLSFTGSGRASYAVAIPASGGSYKVRVTLLARSAGDLTFNFANNDAGTNASTQVFIPRTPGTYEVVVAANAGNTTFRINGVSGYVGEVDDISVKPNYV